MRTMNVVAVAAAALLGAGQISGADEAKREPSAFLGMALPDLAVGSGRWVKDVLPPARAELVGKVRLVVTNSFL